MYKDGTLVLIREKWGALKRAVVLVEVGLWFWFWSRCLLGLGGLLGLLGQQDGLDVGQHASLSDGDSSEQLVELLVVADRQLQVSGDDPGLLVVPGSVSSQLQDLSGQVLQHGRQVHGGSGTDTLGVVALPQQPVDTTHRELEPGPGRAGLGLGSGLSSGLSSSRHVRMLSTRSTQTSCGPEPAALLYISGQRAGPPAGPTRAQAPAGGAAARGLGGLFQHIFLQ